MNIHENVFFYMLCLDPTGAEDVEKTFTDAA